MQMRSKLYYLNRFIQKENSGQLLQYVKSLDNDRKKFRFRREASYNQNDARKEKQYRKLI
jgi:hypothetical protein